MSFFGMMILFLGVARLLGLRRRNPRRFRYAQYGHWRQHRLELQREIATPVPAPAPQPRETPFEALKRRYVDGQISDERYERELDDLLQTPEGRRQV